VILYSKILLIFFSLFFLLHVTSTSHISFNSDSLAVGYCHKKGNFQPLKKSAQATSNSGFACRNSSKILAYAQGFFSLGKKLFIIFKII
jgi:hypothetical protein